MSLKDDTKLLAQYTGSLPDFQIVKPEIPIPYNHMGATIADAILQAGTTWETVVKPRIKKLLTFPEAKTTRGFYNLLEKEGSDKILDWKDKEKPRRVYDVINLFFQEQIETENDLKNWLKNDLNTVKLKAINGIGNKTIDYFKILSGISTSAIDRHLIQFLKNAGIDIKSTEYNRAKQIIHATADIMKIDKSTLDHSIWAYMSKHAKISNQCDRKLKKLNLIPSIDCQVTSNIQIGPYLLENIVLCSADAGPKSQRKTATQAQYFFPGAKWVGALRNASERLKCKFVILTTSYGLVDPMHVIKPYDMHLNDYKEIVTDKWKTTISSLIGNAQYRIMLFYAGGCPRDSILKVMVPILHENKIDLLTFGKPNMFDIDKIEAMIHLLVKGSSLNKLKNILQLPQKLIFIPGAPEKSFHSKTHDLINMFWVECRQPFSGDGLCQCETEDFISKSKNPQVMRAFLMLGIFIDQMMYTHFGFLYDNFRRDFKYPKLYSHPSGGTSMASPNWFIYSHHGFDRRINWDAVKTVSLILMRDLQEWLEKRPEGNLLFSKFTELMIHEIRLEFEQQNHDKLISILFES